jgi:hypothetical protein
MYINILMKLTNMVVPPGKSGRPAEYNSSDSSLETEVYYNCVSLVVSQFEII